MGGLAVKESKFHSTVSGMVKHIPSPARVKDATLGAVEWVDGARQLEETVLGMVGKEALPAFKKVRCLSALTALQQVGEIGVSVHTLATNKKVSKRETTVKLISSSGGLCYSASNVVSFLSDSQLIRTFAWAGHLSLFSGVISIVCGLRSAIKDLGKTNEDLKLLNEKSLESVRKHLKRKHKHKQLLEGYFGGDAKQVIKNLKAISLKADKQKLAMSALKARITSVKRCQYLAIVSVAVSAVAMGILVVNPVACVGYGIFFGLAVVDITKWAYQKRMTQAFTKAIAEMAA